MVDDSSLGVFSRAPRPSSRGSIFQVDRPSCLFLSHTLSVGAYEIVAASVIWIRHACSVFDSRN